MSRALKIAVYKGGGGGGSYFPYILLNESKRCSQKLQSDHRGSCQRICVLIMCITPKTKDQRFLRRSKNMAVEGGTVSQYFWVTFLAETSKGLEIILITIVLSFTNSLSRTSLCFSLKTSFFYSNLFSLAKTQYYILVIRKLLILSISLFSVWFFNLSISSSGETCPARVGLRIYTAAVTLACVVQFQYQRTNAICEKSKEETRSLILKKQRFRI